jgi:hypothetical protein
VFTEFCFELYKIKMIDKVRTREKIGRQEMTKATAGVDEREEDRQLDECKKDDG